MKNKHLYHIIWTSFGAFAVWDKRGNWSALKMLYQELENQQISYVLSHEFYGNYENKQTRNQLLFDSKDRLQISDDIQGLCRKGGDRIIDGLELKLLYVEENYVEMIVASETLEILQKLARIKSRTATLLSFKNPEKFSGKGTWGKGIWISRINNKHDLAISIIKSNFQHKIKQTK